MIYKNNISAPQRGRGYTVTISTSTVLSTPTIEYDEGSSGWISVSGENPYTITVSNYISGDTLQWRSGTVKIADNANNEWQIRIRQTNGYIALWSDYPYSSSPVAGMGYSYALAKDGTMVFEGSTVAINSTEMPKPINIPRMAESWLDTNVDLASTGWTNLGSLDMNFYKYNGTTYQYDRGFNFCNDWSYEYDFYNTSRCINAPINGKFDGRMILPFCVYDADSSTYSYTADGTAHTLGTPDNPFSMRVIVPGSASEINFYNTYKVGCGKGAFYYRNRYGGMDAFLIEGNIKKTDTYNRETYADEGKRTSRNVITESYRCSTGWLSDEESERMAFHLLPSTTVIYQDFETAEMKAIRLTDTSTEWKRFANGRNLVKYEINFETSRKFKNKK